MITIQPETPLPESQSQHLVQHKIHFAQWLHLFLESFAKIFGLVKNFCRYLVITPSTRLIVMMPYQYCNSGIVMGAMKSEHI